MHRLGEELASMLDKTRLMIVLQQDKENGREPVLTIENPGL